jgi:hypothetical protein
MLLLHVCPAGQPPQLSGPTSSQKPHAPGAHVHPPLLDPTETAATVDATV